MDGVTRIVYYKRYRMEIDLSGVQPTPVPAGFAFVPWEPGLLECHAEVLYASFFGEIDALVFPSLGDRLGCSGLMSEISRRLGFLPGATWLLTGPDGPCGTIQG